jgi:hypothetical protein
LKKSATKDGDELDRDASKSSPLEGRLFVSYWQSNNGISCPRMQKIVIHEYAEGFALRLALILSIHVELETGK